MAASDARPMPRKNTAFRVTFPIYNSSGDLATGASGLDSEVSIDAGTFADCTNEATEIATSSGIYYLDLTAGEMNGDTVALNVKSTGNKNTTIVIYPEEIGDIRADVVQISGDTTAADNLESFTDGTGYAGTNNVIPTVTTTTTATNVTIVNGLASGVITAASIADGAIDAATFAAGAINAAAIAADAITAAKLASDVTTEIQSGLLTSSAFDMKIGTPAGASLAADVAAVKSETAAILTDTAEIGTAGAGLTAVASAANLATLTGYVDTEVAAIKAKTDNLPASPAATGDIPSASSIASAVWSYVAEGALTAVQLYRIIVAALAGKSTGGGTTSVAFRDVADSKNRIAATVDADGNRTAITLDGS